MGRTSTIEWTDATWNPFTGCKPVSPGCKHCYATRLAIRFQGAGVPGFAGVARSTADGPKWTGTVGHRPNLLDPIRWKRPRRIFVNSQSDTFHEDHPDAAIDRVFGVMLACHVLDNVAGHTFQVLTKRSARMRSYLKAPAAELLMRWARAVDYEIHVGDGDTMFSEVIEGHCSALWHPDSTADTSATTGYMAHPENLFPLPNVWLGVSIESAHYRSRSDDLGETPAAKRFLSLEPLLGPMFAVILNSVARKLGPVDWVIVGGESCAGKADARPLHPGWVRQIRDVCARYRTPFFFKQWGEWCPIDQQEGNAANSDQRSSREIRRLLPSGDWSKSLGDEAEPMELVGKKHAGAFLDGRKHEEWPA